MTSIQSRFIENGLAGAGCCGLLPIREALEISEIAANVVRYEPSCWSKANLARSWIGSMSLLGLDLI
jgi:hypothetical protein